MSENRIVYELRMKLRELKARIRNGEQLHEEYNNTMHELMTEHEIERMVALNV